MILNSFIQLSENEKRFIFVLLLAIIILILVVVGIGYIINRVMKHQSQKLETAVYDVVVNKIIDNEKAFRKYAFKKNCQMFIKQSWLPLFIVLAGGIIWLLRNVFTNDFSYNIMSKDNGFCTLLFLWDFNDPSCHAEFFGVNLLCKWPPLINSPRLVAEAWASYVTIPCFIIGGFWYLITVQGFFARLFKTRSLSRTIFLKSLENYNQLRGFENPTPQPQIQPQQNPYQQQMGQYPQQNPIFPDQNNNGNGFPPYGGQQ